jgi:hypothetical protein
VAGLLTAAVAACGPPAQPAGSPEAGACKACHQQIVAGFTQTAHFHTSAEASPEAVKGRFSKGVNVLRTRVPGVYFVMEHRADGFYETSVDSATNDKRAARIDLVVGSGRRGQTYLYWSNDQLFEMPVSYVTAAGAWINSPGYQDGKIDWARPIIPRCLECHSTSFTLVVKRGQPRYLRDYALGISCKKCHGDTRAHVAYHSAHPRDTTARDIVNPARLPRARQLDNCALCHSGDRPRLMPAFTYHVGQPLSEYLLPASGNLIPDVHGNQVGLLERSKCFLASPALTCTTCHDVHQPQRDVAWFAQKCLGCHDASRHPMADRIGGRLITDCVDCHMPNRESTALEFNAPSRQVPMYFRSHNIAIYPDVAKQVLRSREGTQQP